MMLAVLMSFAGSISPLMALLISVTREAIGILAGVFDLVPVIPVATLTAPAGGGAGPDDDAPVVSISSAGGFLLVPPFPLPWYFLTPEVEVSLCLENAGPLPMNLVLFLGTATPDVVGVLTVAVAGPLPVIRVLLVDTAAAGVVYTFTAATFLPTLGFAELTPFPGFKVAAAVAVPLPSACFLLGNSTVLVLGPLLWISIWLLSFL